MNNILHEKPSDPTVSVFIDGLGLLCFNDNPNCAEVGFINADGHPLAIYICDSERNVIESFPSDKIPTLEGAEITINAAEVGESRCYQHPESKENDDEDFRWMVDIDNIYKNRVEFSDKAADNIRAKLYINNGIFYTKVKSRNDAVLKDAFTFEDKMTLGRIGKIVGADISSNEVEIKIKPKQGDEQTVTLKRNGSSAYYVDIRYNCQIPKRTDGRSDFYEIYKIINPPKDKPRYSLEYKGVEEQWRFIGHNTTFAEEVCQIIVIGGDYRGMPR